MCALHVLQSLNISSFNLVVSVCSPCITFCSNTCQYLFIKFKVWNVLGLGKYFHTLPSENISVGLRGSLRNFCLMAASSGMSTSVTGSLNVLFLVSMSPRLQASSKSMPSPSSQSSGAITYPKAIAAISDMI